MTRSSLTAAGILRCMDWELWSWILIGAAGLKDWLAGSGRRSAWLLGLGSQALWAAYAICTEQWGFLVSAALYAGIYRRNWRRTRGAMETDQALLADTEEGLIA